jgi:hypothetical protein
VLLEVSEHRQSMPVRLDLLPDVTNFTIGANLTLPRITAGDSSQFDTVASATAP